jgi:hypothetical protein
MNVYRRSDCWCGPWRFCVGRLLVVLCSVSFCRTSQAIATPQPRNVSVGGWRYTTSAPSRDWMQIDYRDATWTPGEPGFGNQGLPPFQQSLVKTAWVTPNIWIRGTFELQDITSPLALRLSHDEDVEVFINGVMVCQRKGYIADYVIHRLGSAASAALRPGRNVLAAHCRQTIGGQFLDVQVLDLSPMLPRRRSIESILAELGPVPRPEHPRPDRVRKRWQNLNGVWEFAFDPKDAGVRERWNDGRPLSGRIVVPFCPESLLSGVFDEDIHPVCWYARTFDVPESLRGDRVLLHFGAVDYRTDVWLNGRHLGRHEGGYDPFYFDVTESVKPSGNRLTLRVHDDPREAKPRGKQSPARYPEGCIYMRVTGIWQTVWIESVGKTFVRDWTAQTDPETGRLKIHAECDGPTGGLRLQARVERDGKELAASRTSLASSPMQFAVTVPNVEPWSPERPVLYDLVFLVSDGKEQVVDCVTSYVGFRHIETRGGSYWLNGKPFFFASALDQGYYPTGLYTPPSDADLRRDVEWAKRYGLNGVRKHQIVPEPRYLYWCDRLGLAVWGEMADWGADFSDAESFRRQWRSCVLRDVNHPCIITWVPTNEWTSPEDDRVNRTKVLFYEATKALDPTRPVIDTSGYCHTRTDVVDLHVNPPDGKACRHWWESWRRSIAASGNFPAYPDRPAYAKGFRHQGQPVVISETGNWRISELGPMGLWTPYGYGPIPTTREYLDTYREFFLSLIAERDCAGFCYVQLYDVEGEVNGYLTYYRRPKIPPQVISEIHAEGLRNRLRGRMPFQTGRIEGSDENARRVADTEPAQ